MTLTHHSAAEMATEYAVSAPQTAAVMQPDLLPAVSVGYSGWRLSRLPNATARTVYVAFKENDAAHEHTALRLVASQSVLCEGYWPFRPTWEPRLILGGACLYTAAWAVRFAATADGVTPRPLKS